MKISARLVVSLVAAAIGAAAPASGSAAPDVAPPNCISADFSPAFEEDRKGFCVAFDPSDGQASTFRFFLTDDGGRSWERREGAGFTTTGEDAIGSVVASPAYPTDRTVFVQTNRGIFSTTDDGATFSLIDNLAGTGPSGPNLSAFVDDSPGLPGTPQGARPMLAWASGDSPTKIDPPHRVPVTGAPFDERRFYFPTPAKGGPTAYTMTVQTDASPSSIRSRNVLFGCNEQLVCGEQLFAFPWTYQFDLRGGVWFASDFARSGRIYFTTARPLAGSSSLKAWTSDDGGATFRPWESVNRLLRPLRHLDMSRPTVGLGLHHSRPRTIYMRLGYWLSPEADDGVHPPIERFFVSRDRGRSWRLLSLARDDDQSGPRGSIPWDGKWGYPESNFVELTGDGRLFVMASRLGGHSGLYCSTDGGRHWAPSCADR